MDLINKIDKYLNELSVPQKHQLKIAKDTLKMSDAGAKAIGGMTKDEARAFLKSIGWNDKKIKKLEQ
jgi:predicted translin family RNA/ssDNA-binding protein